MKCEYCGKKYDTESGFLKDCFVSSDGWSWEYFHECRDKSDVSIHGYDFANGREVSE